MTSRLVPLVLIAALAAGCTAVSPPPDRLGLKLLPSALGASISLQQQLRVEREGRVDHLEGALEVDDTHVGMIGLALGQRMMSLDYDGRTLKSWRHALLPEQVRGEDVLEDIQLTYWPLEAIRAALPTGWHVEEQGMRRMLWSSGTQVMVIDYSTEPRWEGAVVLSNLRYQYKLTIQSVRLNP